MEAKKIKLHLRCFLTDEEKLAIGNTLADKTNELREIENDKSRVVADFKAKATSVESDIGVASNKLRSGYEFRDVDCKVEYNDPVAGKRTVYRLDTPPEEGWTVEVQDMSEEEILRSQQQELPLGETTTGEAAATEEESHAADPAKPNDNA
jgi:hypothetical protein